MKYKQLVRAIASAHDHLASRAVAVVNHALVLRNWIVGAYIVEFEQNGQDRARYGVRLLPRLAEDLQKRGHGGLGVSMLELMRRFYQVYPQLAARIPQPVVTEMGLPLEFRQIADSVTSGHGISPPVVKRLRPATSSLVAPLSAEFLPPIGIILCSDKDQTKVEFATAGLDNKLFVSRYLVALPSAEQLARFVERDRADLEASAVTTHSAQRHPPKRRGGQRA